MITAQQLLNHLDEAVQGSRVKDGVVDPPKKTLPMNRPLQKRLQGLPDLPGQFGEGIETSDLPVVEYMDPDKKKGLVQGGLGATTILALTNPGARHMLTHYGGHGLAGAIHGASYLADALGQSGHWLAGHITSLT